MQLLDRVLCVKQRVEKELWLFGEPSVHWKREKGPDSANTIQDLYPQRLSFPDDDGCTV